MKDNSLRRFQRKLDWRPIVILLVLYGLVQWLPFEIFGWIQNEDGLMEWASVVLLGLAGTRAFKMAGNKDLSQRIRLGWIIFLLFCILFIGEEISWGERLHGYGIEAVRMNNTQNETNFHNLAEFQSRGLLHYGWAAIGITLGIGSSIIGKSPLLPDRRLCLFFLIPALWYVGFELCRKPDTCLATVANHQEIYEFLVACGLFLHAKHCSSQIKERQ